MLAHPNAQCQAYVTISQARNGRQVYNPVVVDARGQRNVPVNIRRHTLRNVLSVAMSFAHAKGFPFQITDPALLAEAIAVRDELATDYGIDVTIQGDLLRDVTVGEGDDAVELSLFPWEDKDAVAADLKAMFDEADHVASLDWPPEDDGGGSHPLGYSLPSERTPERRLRLIDQVKKATSRADRETALNAASKFDPALFMDLKFMYPVWRLAA